jgi:hypothetical protein
MSQGYTILGEQSTPGTPRTERGESDEPQVLFAASLLDTNRPDPELFVTIEPDSTYEVGSAHVRIVLSDDDDGNTLLGTDQILSVTTQSWPSDPQGGEKLRQGWAALGFLWLDPVVSGTVKVHIDEAPEIKRCPENYL